MIILHPNSVCDVCLEGYGATNVPYAITCGHIFCIRCLRSLTRQNCPLCRTGFHGEDVRKLHVDESARSTTPLSRPPSPYRDVSPSPARDFQARINQIVQNGVPTADLTAFISEVREWLGTQSEEKHPDLRSSWLLLYKYSSLRYKYEEGKDNINELKQDIETLQDRMQADRQNAEARYNELSQKRVAEMETAMAVERSLRDQYDTMDKDWRSKYETCLADVRRLTEEIRRLKHNPMPTLSKPSDSRQIHTSDRTSGHSHPEPMTIVEDEFVDEESAEDDKFILSPIHPSAMLPTSSRANRQIFRPLTADESDVEDLKSRRTNPYLRRSIDPINIRPPVHRMNSNTSLLSRHDSDASMSRSIPRSSVDVHMASCSSSPTTSRDDPMFSYMSSNGSRTSKTTEPPKASALTHEEEAMHERWRAQLHQVLETPQAREAPLKPSETRPRQISPASSLPATRAASPTSSASSSVSMAPPPNPTNSVSTSSLLRAPDVRPPLSRASTAAMQAERERARSISSREPTRTTSPTAHTSHSNRDIPSYQTAPTTAPPAPSNSQYYARRPSVSSVRKPAPAIPSGLTRSMWAMQEPQRAS